MDIFFLNFGVGDSTDRISDFAHVCFKILQIPFQEIKEREKIHGNEQRRICKCNYIHNNNNAQ